MGDSSTKGEKKHKHGMEEYWKKMLWTGESKFKVFGSQRRHLLRHRINEKIQKECLMPHVKH